MVCGHRSARQIGGTEANFWRLTCAAVLLGLWAYGHGVGTAGEAFPVFALSGMVGIGIGDLAMFLALPRLGSRLSLLLVECLSAPFGAFIEWLWLGTSLSAAQLGFGATILAGVGLALKPGKQRRRASKGLILGSSFCVLSALATAFGAVLSRKAYAIAEAAGPPLDGGNAAFQRVLGGLLVAGLCLLAAKRPEFRAQAGTPRRLLNAAAKEKWRRVWPWIVLNGLAGQTLGVSCMQWALRTTPTGIVLAIIAVTPIVAIPLALVAERERPTRLSLLGGAVAVAGVVALTLSR